MTVEGYGPDFFEMHVPWRAEYERFADSIAKHLAFESVLDLGCGNGFLIEHLSHVHGKAAWGVDGSPDAVNANPRVAIEHFDLRRPYMGGSFGLVICTEVAEHIERLYENVLVQSIARASSGLVLFSAAKPGAGGYLHVNERPQAHWVRKFRNWRFQLDAEKTASIRADLAANIETWWFTQNVIVLRNGKG
jgi:SAM-dependent methyltransferase